MRRLPTLAALLLLAGCTVTLLAVREAPAQQRIQFPTAPSGAYQPGVWSGAPVNGAPAAASPSLPPAAANFDPYGSGSANVAPSLLGQPQPAQPGLFGPPAYPPGGPSVPNAYGAGPAYGTPYGYDPALNPNAFPGQQPNSLFPNGFPTLQDFGLNFGQQPGPYQRLFQNTGMTYTFLGGGDGAALQLNEFDIHTSLFLPQFLLPQAPLFITPGFTFTLTEGPSGPVTSDVPGALYAAYLDFAWYPRFTPQFGADVDVRVGVYSDFQTVTTDSIRITGIAAADIIVSPWVRAKIGVEYLDRVDKKLFPYVGIIWRPNEYSQWDILFPHPRYSRYLTTVGAHNTAVWWYIGAEYGGGSWTIERAEAPDAGASDRLDINDIRLALGLEWRCQQQGGPRGFAEIGYVFDRDLRYYLVPADDVSLKDTIMLRAGFTF